MMRRSIIQWLVMLLLGLALMPAAAQDNADEDIHPLLEMLGFVPLEIMAETSFFDLSYVDYRAFETALGIFRPAGTDLTTVAAGNWIQHSFRLAARPEFIQYVFSQPDEMLEAVGFTVFDIDRALMFGQPPGNGIVLAGEPDRLTDMDTLNRKFMERELKAREVDGGFTLWQHPDRDGLAIDLENRNPAYPFGGHLGRAEPVAMRPGYLLNSAAIDTVQAMIAADTAQTASLADVPEFVALVGAITQDGPLIQAHFFSPADVGFIPGDPMAVIMGQDAPNVLADYGPLPVYSMSALGDTQDSDGNSVLLAALVYADAEDAASAADELAQRIATLRLPVTNEETVLEIFDATVSVDVYESADGLAVALARISYPPPGDTSVIPGQMYSRWIRGVWTREFFIFMIPE